MKPSIVSVRDIQHFDQQAVGKYGIPSIVLMENAGRAVAQAVKNKVKRFLAARVVIVAGPGNNGGDGFVAARHLLIEKIKPMVFVVGNNNKYSPDARINYDILKKLKCPMHAIHSSSLHFQKELNNCHCIVDAIFGVGLNRALPQPVVDIINSINKAKVTVIAVDVPSGLDADTGLIWGACVRAAMTVTFSASKQGMLKNDGPSFCGRIIPASIGMVYRRG